MPVRGLDVDLEAVLRRRSDVALSVVGFEEIVRNGVRGDVFCNGHGEVYPVDIEDRLFEFLRQGGGLLHLGGTVRDGGETPRWKMGRSGVHLR